MVSEVKRSNFKEEVILSDKLVLVDLYAPWCGPCRALAPVLEEIAEKYQDKVKVVKVNVDEEESIAQRFGVMSIPTVIFFRDGKAVASFVGLKSPSEIESIVEKHL
ncbi:MAG TPA: thioredoxin [Clostridiales bacterium]|jgi:thioredoxin|uniref:thioredoxin n=1 Tax=Candidatus Fimenecus sp. TaxID=3022888 RepID=UPI000EC02994|nr:thioredoxin [Clostridiales bacterium]